MATETTTATATTMRTGAATDAGESRVSLKVIHVFFITVSMLMCAGIAAFRLSAWQAGGGSPALVQGAAASIGAILLGGYAVHFIRKYRGLGYQ